MKIYQGQRPLDENIGDCKVFVVEGEEVQHGYKKLIIAARRGNLRANTGDHLDQPKKRFESLLEDVGQGYLWGRENGNSDAMAFSSGVLMRALTMLHPTYIKDRLQTLHKEMLHDLEQRYNTFKAHGGITFIVPLDDEDTDQNEEDL